MSVTDVGTCSIDFLSMSINCFHKGEKLQFRLLNNKFGLSLYSNPLTLTLNMDNHLYLPYGIKVPLDKEDKRKKQKWRLQSIDSFNHLANLIGNIVNFALNQLNLKIKNDQVPGTLKKFIDKDTDRAIQINMVVEEKKWVRNITDSKPFPAKQDTSSSQK